MLFAVCYSGCGTIRRDKVQSKKMSLVESLTNVAIGYSINCTAQALIFPHFGLHCSIRQNLSIGLIFTVISIARSYCLRRLFTRGKIGRIIPGRT